MLHLRQQLLVQVCLPSCLYRDATLRPSAVLASWDSGVVPLLFAGDMPRKGLPGPLPEPDSGAWQDGRVTCSGGLVLKNDIFSGPRLCLCDPQGNRTP